MVQHAARPAEQKRVAALEVKDELLRHPSPVLQPALPLYSYGLYSYGSGTLRRVCSLRSRYIVMVYIVMYSYGSGTLHLRTY